MDDTRSFLNCKWWSPFGETNDEATGICTSVFDNDYAQTDLRHKDS